MPFVTEELGRALTGVETLTLGPGRPSGPATSTPRPRPAWPTSRRRSWPCAGSGPSTGPHPAGPGWWWCRRRGQAALFRAEADSVRRLARLEGVEVGSAPAVPAAKLLAGRAELYLPLEGLLDLDEERARLDRELATLGAERPGPRPSWPTRPSWRRPRPRWSPRPASAWPRSTRPWPRSAPSRSSCPGPDDGRDPRRRGTYGPGRAVPVPGGLDGLEARWGARWEADGTYRFDPARPREDVYAIDFPP